MRALIGLAFGLAFGLALAACGVHPPPEPPPPGAEVGRAISLEWKAEQSDDGRVGITLIVDGKEQAIGLLDAATEDEPGTPATCALRAAHPLRTELQCGAVNFYAAELHANELVVTINDGEHVIEVKRIPVEGTALAVRPYQL